MKNLCCGSTCVYRTVCISMDVQNIPKGKENLLNLSSLCYRMHFKWAFEVHKYGVIARPYIVSDEYDQRGFLTSGSSYHTNMFDTVLLYRMLLIQLHIHSTSNCRAEKFTLTRDYSSKCTVLCMQTAREKNIHTKNNACCIFHTPSGNKNIPGINPGNSTLSSPYDLGK